MDVVQFLFGFLLSAVCVQAAGLDWWSIDSDLDLSQTKSVAFQQMLGVIDIDGIGKIPIWARFESSHRFPESPLFGKNWYVPLLQSHAVLLDEHRLMVDFPDGKSLTFYRNASNGAITPIGEWAPAVTDNTLVITSKNGWILTFLQGRLATIKKGTATITVSDKALTANGKPLLRAEMGDSASGYGTVFIGGHAVVFELKNTPNVQNIAGARVISGFSPSLGKLRWDNGRQVVFENQVEADFKNHITITETNPSVASLRNYSGLQTFVYDSETGISSAFSLPSATSDEKTPASNKVNRYQTGLLAGRIRSIQSSDSNDQNPVARFSYDEKGAILRGSLGNKQISRNGHLTISVDGHPSWYYDESNGTFCVSILPASQ